MIAQRDVMISEIYARAKIDKNIFFLSADFGAPALDEFRENLPEQFFHLGISEQNMIDVAIGMALKGKKVFTYAMAPFISMRCAEQHKLAAMMGLPIVNIVAGVGLGYANAGPTHYATEDYSLALNIIGSSVFTMSDAPLVKSLTNHLLDNPTFCFVRLDRSPSRELSTDYEFIDGFRRVRAGKSTCLVSHGYLVHKIDDLIESSSNIGEPSIYDLFWSKPIPDNFINVISKYDKVVFVDEQIESSSIGSFILPRLLKATGRIEFEMICLAEEYMFENSGRDGLIKEAGITDEAIKKSIIQK